MAIPWIQIATTVAKLSHMAITGKEISGQIYKLVKKRDRSTPTDPSVVKQLDQLEKAVEMQTTLNEQYNAQLDLLKSTLEHIQKNFRLLYIAMLLSFLISVTAIIFVFIR